MVRAKWIFLPIYYILCFVYRLGHSHLWNVKIKMQPFCYHLGSDGSIWCARGRRYAALGIGHISHQGALLGVTMALLCMLVVQGNTYFRINWKRQPIFPSCPIILRQSHISVCSSKYPMYQICLRNVGTVGNARGPPRKKWPPGLPQRKISYFKVTSDYDVNLANGNYLMPSFHLLRDEGPITELHKYPPRV